MKAIPNRTADITTRLRSEDELERIEEERHARSRPRNIAETKVRLARESERARRIAEAAARLARETERAKNIAEATSRLAGESAKSAPQGPTALEPRLLMPTSAPGVNHPTPRPRINRRGDFGYRPSVPVQRGHVWHAVVEHEAEAQRDDSDWRASSFKRGRCP